MCLLFIVLLNIIIDSKPNILQLKRLKDENGRLSIIQSIAANDYTTFGQYLLDDTSGYKVKLVTQGCDKEKSVEAIISAWLREVTDPKPTFSYLVQCIEDAEMKDLAQYMKSLMAESEH